MPLPTAMLPTTCDIYRPFGAASPTTTAVPCRLIPRLEQGRGIPGVHPVWSHFMDVDESVSILDGCTRIAGADAILYADGDEVRVPTGGSGTRFAVMWVETHNLGTSAAFKRVYLLRH